MATPQLTKDDPSHLRALVDMGSNGIRFSITTLAPPTARITPTLYQSRAGISLYDAQYPASSNGVRQPIDSQTIAAVVSAYRSFKRTCADFGVPESNVTVLATEATRTAINSKEFMQSIRKAVGWDVTLLAKSEEGRVGAMGVASSLPEVRGLVMDLGGGSTQLTWLMGSREGVMMPEGGSVSMPYGAAALSRRLGEAEAKAGRAEGSRAVEELHAEVRETVRNAYQSLQVPEEMLKQAEVEGGFTLYLSGGGYVTSGLVVIVMILIASANGYLQVQRLGLYPHESTSSKALSDSSDQRVQSLTLRLPLYVRSQSSSRSSTGRRRGGQRRHL